MTNSLLAERRAGPVRGVQTPRIEVFPTELDHSQAEDVFEFCEEVGLFLDPWQKLWLRHGLAEREEHKWAAFEVAGVVSRQNGKGEVLMAREIAGLYLLDERTQIHSAHQFKTCREAFLKMKVLIQSSPLLERQVKQIRDANGEEGIELLNGARLKYVARSNNSGRGFTGDLIVFDEAQVLGNGPIEDMMPTLSTKPYAQVWYAGTAGTEESIYLARLRERAKAGDAGRLAYVEWSVDEDDYDPDDRAQWAMANPALGIRISEEYVEDEQRAMSDEGFGRERLGVGTWPTEGSLRVIPADRWYACEDRNGRRPEGTTVFALDVDPDRSHASLAVCGRRADGQVAVEIADATDPTVPARRGIEWVAERVKELDAKWMPVGWVVDVGGPASTFIPPLQAEVNIIEASYREVAQASEGFYDGVMDGTTRHTGDVLLGGAVAGAAKRTCGDGWAWGRRVSSCDISPLVAASLARWGFLTKADELAPDDVFVG